MPRAALPLWQHRAMGLLGRLRRQALDLDERVIGDRPPGPGMYTKRSEALRAGDHVRVTALSLRNQTGVLVRPARLLSGKPAWLVQMDNPKALWRGRTRVADRSLTVISPDE
jgi:hypothetical protein